jgi:histone-arginine methyltransferase CARM1
VATWFDVLFNGSTSQRWLSTAPGLPATHWFQLRCVLSQPLVVLTPNSKVTGSLRLVAHERQSYDIHLELKAPPIAPGMPAHKVRPGWGGTTTTVCCSRPWFTGRLD